MQLWRTKFELDGINSGVGTIAYQYGYIIDDKRTSVPFSALTLLVGWQEGHLVRKKLSGAVLVW